MLDALRLTPTRLPGTPEPTVYALTGSAMEFEHVEQGSADL